MVVQSPKYRHRSLTREGRGNGCSVSNENWYVDQTRCEENESKGLDDRRSLEQPRPRPTPPKIKNARFQRKSVPRPTLMNMSLIYAKRVIKSYML